jgi:hypothetical protein
MTYRCTVEQTSTIHSLITVQTVPMEQGHLY